MVIIPRMKVRKQACLRCGRESGGCTEFDLKAWSEPVHLALCGVSNERAMRNFEHLLR
jgi:pyruvate-formate lyase-activating enzyme